MINSRRWLMTCVLKWLDVLSLIPAGHCCITRVHSTISVLLQAPWVFVGTSAQTTFAFLFPLMLLGASFSSLSVSCEVKVVGSALVHTSTTIPIAAYRSNRYTLSLCSAKRFIQGWLLSPLMHIKEVHANFYATFLTISPKASWLFEYLLCPLWTLELEFNFDTSSYYII